MSTLKDLDQSYKQHEHGILIYEFKWVAEMKASFRNSTVERTSNRMYWTLLLTLGLEEQQS